MASYWEEVRKRSLTRRRFLGRGAAAGAGIAGLALVGCGDDDDDDDVTPEETAATTPAGTSEATPGTEETQTPAAGEPRQGGTVRVTHIGPSALPYDPHMSPAESQGVIWDTVGGTLLRSDRQLVIRPYLAESWEAPDDTTYVFRLFDGIRYDSREPTNGRPFTAEDVVFNVERATNPDPQFLMAKPKFKFMQSVEAVDDLTVRFTMQKPYAPFPALMAIGFWFIAPEAVEQYGDGSVPDAVRGPGPYKAVQIEEADFLRLERNENYFQPGVPYADVIEATYYAEPGSAAAAFVSDQLDLIHNSTTQDRRQMDEAGVEYTTQNAVSSGHFSFELNSQREPFQDARIRRALHLAVDRQALVRLSEAASNPGEPLGVIAAWLQPFALPNDELYSRPGFREPKDEDIAEARKLLAAAGYDDANPLQTTAIAWTAWSETFAVWVQEWMRAIGVELNIEEVDTYAGLIGRMNERNYDASVSGYSIGFEPDDQIYDFYYTGGLRNYTTFGDAAIDTAIEAQQSELNQEARIEILHQLQRDILDADPGLIWLHGNGIVSASKPNVHGHEHTPDSVHDYRFDQLWIES